MTREECLLSIEHWESEASMAEEEMREAEERCQELYDVLDAMDKVL